MAGRRDQGIIFLNKLHVVFETEGDKNWPISVKIMVRQNA